MAQQFTVKYFHTSPDVSNPACICSLCSKAFDEEMPPLRLFFTPDGEDKAEWEMRFHDQCFEQVFCLDAKALHGFRVRPDVKLHFERGD